MLIIQQPMTRKQQFYCYLVVGIALLVLWPIYLAYLNPIVFPLDDAYIVLHNAQVLHLGHDNNYLGVPALIGSTSIIHTALVSLFLFWATPLKASLVVQVFSIFLYMIGLLRLAFVLDARPWQVLCLLVISLTIGYSTYHLLSGLETALTMAGVTWSLVFASQPIKSSQRISLTLLCGALPFLRPEFGLWSILLLLYQASRYKQLGNTNLFVFYKFCQDSLLVLVSVAPWLIFYWLNTGLVLPNSLKSKLAFYVFATLPFNMKWVFAKERLVVFIYDLSYLGFFGMLSLLLLTKLGRIALVFILSLLGFYIFYFSCGIDFNYWRYLYPLLPLLFYGLLEGLRQQDKLLRMGANVLLFIMLIQALLLLPQHWKIYLGAREYTINELVGVTQWLQQHVPKDSTLLIHDAGYLAFATSFHLVDMVGLKSPSSISYHEQFTLPSSGTKRVQAISKIMRNQPPQFLVIRTDWNYIFKITKGLAELGWHVQLVRSAPQDGFAVYRVLPSGI